MICEYATHNLTGVVHLSGGLAKPGRTLCGQPTSATTRGDETMSGLVATCATCKSYIEAANGPGGDPFAGLPS